MKAIIALLCCLVVLTEARSRHVVSQKAHRHHASTYLAALEETPIEELKAIRANALSRFTSLWSQANSPAGAFTDVNAVEDQVSSLTSRLSEQEAIVTEATQAISAATSDIANLRTAIRRENRLADEVVWNEYSDTRTIEDYNAAKQRHYDAAAAAEAEISTQNAVIEKQTRYKKAAAIKVAALTSELRSARSALAVARDQRAVQEQNAQVKKAAKDSLALVAAQINVAARHRAMSYLAPVLPMLLDTPLSGVTAQDASGLEVSVGGKFVADVYRQCLLFAEGLTAQKSAIETAISQLEERVAKLENESEELEAAIKAKDDIIATRFKVKKPAVVTFTREIAATKFDDLYLHIDKEYSVPAAALNGVTSFEFRVHKYHNIADKKFFQYRIDGGKWTPIGTSKKFATLKRLAKFRCFGQNVKAACVAKMVAYCEAVGLFGNAIATAAAVNDANENVRREFDEMISKAVAESNKLKEQLAAVEGQQEKLETESADLEQQLEEVTAALAEVCLKGDQYPIA